MLREREKKERKKERRRAITDQIREEIRISFVTGNDLLGIRRDHLDLP
jgi:hypothetical protein